MITTALVQYSHPQRGINTTKGMVTPTKVSDLDAWFKQACKTIPGIPKHWFRPEPIITERTILFELIDRKTHEKCAVIILRRK